MHSRKRIAGISFGCAALAQAVNAWALPAFPGAEGFGANAQGGRGGDVYHVTTLVDDPNHLTPGSLFYGLYEKNVPGSGTVPGVGRTIVFDVGGTIHLGSSSLDIKNIKNVTIAGQTAPSPVTIIGNLTQVTSSGGKETGNIIIQNIAFRKGLENSGDSLTIHGAGNTHDIMVDHVSGSWSEDEVISTAGATNHSQNVTVQYSTMSEALTSGHQYGALIRNDTSESVSYDHNLFSNNASRNPRPGTYLNTQLDFEFQNNVIYNWSDRAGYTGGASESDTENVNMNYIGNYAIAGPSTVGGPNTPGGTPVIGARRNTEFTKDASNDPLNLHVYQSGNKIDWGSSVGDPSRHGVDLGWGAFANWNGTVSSAFPAADQNASPFSYPATATADSADIAYAKVISNVGAFAWARVPTDKRLINEVLTYTGTAPQSSPNATEYNAIATATPLHWTDTDPTRDHADPDADGMPNYWETLRGFNPNAADNNTVMGDGYTRLEHYLQYLDAQATWNPDSNGNWSDYLNWRGARPQTMDSTAYFTTVLSAPRTVNLDMAATVGQMSFGSTQAYTISGAGALTFDVISGSATIDVTFGSHGIFTPVTLADNTIVTAAAGSGLTIANLQPSAVTLTKAGAGGLAVNNIRMTGLNITGGTVLVLPDGSAAGVSRITNLSIAAASKLDITNNKLVTATAIGSIVGSTYTGVAGMIQSGRNGGNWSGSTGIVTSQSTATTSNLTSIGVARASDIGISTTGVWAGQTVSSTDTLVMYTYGGDATLDGKINIDDYVKIDQGIAGGFTGWSNGDFNYDGKVNIDDYTTEIDSNIGAQGPPFFTAGGAGFAVTAVPEPAMLGAMIALALPLAASRRRRR